MTTNSLSLICKLGHLNVTLYEYLCCFCIYAKFLRQLIRVKIFNVKLNDAEIDVLYANGVLRIFSHRENKISTD